MNLSNVFKIYRLQLTLTFLFLVALYYLIVPGMVLDWYKDENYSHGFLVPVIAGYFLWQRWPELKDCCVAPNRWGLAVVAVGLLQLLLGWLATEYFTMRSSLIIILAGCVLFWCGWEILKRMSLPLGFLIFMVPIPYIIYDLIAFPLKLLVTKLSVAFLKAIGVVVMHEGNIIMFPNTTLEVADACSGIRSLISLLALAVAYACLLRTSNLRRLIIACSAVIIAILTNALRVIGTGFLSQWWGAAAAEGFFHEFAGLAVFVLATLLLVGLGVLLKGREELVQQTGATSGGGGVLPDCLGEIGRKRFYAVYALMLPAALFLYTHQDREIPINRPLSQFPAQLAGWMMTREVSFSPEVLKVLRPTDYLSRQYRSADGTVVSLYVGYHSGGEGSGGIHSPKHCLPGSGWLEISTGKATVPTPTGNVHLVRAVYQKGEMNELFLYWFQMMDQTITNEYSLKLSEIKNSLLHQRRDQTFFRISIPFEHDESQAMAKGEAFISDFQSTFTNFLPR